MKCAKEILFELNCKYTETEYGIWIDKDVVYKDGSSTRLCWIDKKKKKIIFQDDKKEHELNLKLFIAIYKLVEELGWLDD